MTHDERISSYIDNELSAEQEQEFLISLAASDGLRKSFRGELVLKNVLHQDGLATQPPRDMRAAIFGAVGLAGAGLAADAGRADAATTTAATGSHALTNGSTSLMKVLFATKVNTLVTAATLSLSALAGFGTHALVTSAPQGTVRSTVTPQAVRPQTGSQPEAGRTEALPASDAATTGTSDGVTQNSATTHQRAATQLHKDAPVRGNATGTSASGPVNGAAGGGAITVEDPVINQK